MAGIRGSKAPSRCAVVALAMAAASARFASAAEPAGQVANATVRTMSLAEAREYARTHHGRVVAARQRLEAARREARVADAQWLPRVGAMAQLVGATTNNSTTTLLSTSAVDLPRIGATEIQASADGQPYASTGVALGLRQELFDFGRIAAERQAGVLAAEVDKVRFGAASLDVQVAVDQAFYGVLAAAAIEEASKSAFERAVQHGKLAQANVQSGMRPPIEGTRAAADVARYEAALLRAQAGARIARGVLAVAVGVDDLELDAGSPGPDAGPLPPLTSLLGSIQRAPAVLEWKARADAQRAETTRLEAQNRPNLMATAAVSSRAGGAPPNSGPTPYGAGWLPTVPNYSAGVVLTWNLVEPTWERRAAASRAREQALASEAELALRSQRGLANASYQEAAVAAASLATLQRGADAARANYEQAEQRFRVGVGTSTELADAQALRTEAEVQLAIGRFQVSRTRAILERALAEVR